MGRALLVKVALIAALAALGLWGRRLSERRADWRRASTQVEPLVPQEAREHMVVAMVTLERGGGEAAGGATFDYLRSRGRWRCRQAFSALAVGNRLVQLVDMLLQAEGLMQSDVPERAADYGLGSESSWRVTLRGPAALSDPDGDVLLRIELGNSLPSLGGGFVRRPGERFVLAIDSDPRALLAADPLRPELPPLLDTRLLPADWPGPGARLSRVLVERADGTRYRLELRDREVSDEQRLVGVIPFEWVLALPDGSESPTSPDHAIAYTVFLRLAEWERMLDPRRAQELVMDRLSARIVIEPSQGDPVTLSFGVPDERGTVPLVNTLSQTLQALAADTAALLLPGPTALTDSAAANPWGDRLGR